MAVAAALALFPPGSALAAGSPAVPSAWVTGVTTTSALLHAEIDPQGLATHYRFGRGRGSLTASCPVPAGVSVAPFPFADVGFSFAGGRNLGSVLVRSCRGAGRG